jgi:tetratricopeptide (TPR) repeat protein
LIGKSLGHYEILDTIGAGGMGQVYRARDTKLGRDVALKILPATLQGDRQALTRFEREAKALAALNHPNIVTIYSIEKDNEEHFLTMELVEGKSLDKLVRDEGITIDEFLPLAVPLADALAAAHASGVIHRDLKPANIAVSDAGRVKVLDFGVALVVHETALTEANMTVGTAAYMSPEQITANELDGRSDIFSLGIIFYELLSGSRPFRGDHPTAMAYSIIHEEPSPLDVQPKTLADVVHRCLAKNPADRFTNSDEVRDALQNLSPAESTTSAVQPKPATVPPEIQAAYDRADWLGAYRALHEAAEERELSTGELEMLAMCAMWVNECDESVQTREKAYAMYAKSGKNAAAAGVALYLVNDYIEKGAGAVATGWHKRAERLLQNEPECIEHGRLIRQKTMMAVDKGDFDKAMELNQQCRDIADRLNDSDLEAEALHDRGRILTITGDVEEGMALIDEAMTSAVSGELAPITVGNMYCRTLTVCGSLADYNRAREWSDAAWRWCEPFGVTPYQGVCRVHSAAVMRHQGMWADAERAAQSALDDFKKLGLDNHTAEASNELGELALIKGDHEEAESAFRLAHELGVDPVPGLPLLRLAQGNHETALQSIERALGETPDDRLHRAKLLAASIRIALANNRISLAEAGVNELTTISKDFKCPSFEAHALMGQGAIELERGNADKASPSLRKAWSIFKEAGFPYDAARARTLMAEAYLRAGNKEDAKLQLEAACKTFGELGAKPDLEAASELIRKCQ